MGLWTAVPEGHDAGRGLPVCLILHGASGTTFWQGEGADDPQRMLRDEAPRWASERGFDPGRMAVYGWSMGGYGALLLAERSAGRLAAVAALSPALRLARLVPGGPAVAAWDKGAHTRGYWNRVTPAAFRFIGRALG